MPSWLSYRAFVASAFATAAATYPQAAKLGFSVEAIAEWTVATVVGGLVWGTVITWAMKRYFAKPGSIDGPAAVAQSEASQDAKAQKYSLLSYALVGIAFALPTAVAYFWTGRAGFAGSLSGEMAMAYVVMVLLGWAIFGRKPRLTKAFFRLSAAGVLLIWSAVATLGTWSAQAQMDERGKTFVKSMLEQGKRQRGELSALDVRFNEIDLGTVLAPGNLTTAEGIMASRAKIDKLEGLIKERRELVKKMLADAVAVIRSADVSEFDRQAAVNGVNEKAPATLEMYRRLDAAQLASLEALADLVDLAEANLGRTTVKDGRLLFSTKAALDQYRMLYEKLAVAAAEEERVTKATLEQSARAQDDIRAAERAVTAK